MDLQTKNITPSRLHKRLDEVLAEVKAGNFTIVAVREGPGEEPTVLLVNPHLIKMLGTDYEAYHKLLASPEFGGLEHEVNRLRGVTERMLKQLEHLYGEQGVPKSFYDQIVGAAPGQSDTVHGNVGENDGMWEDDGGGQIFSTGGG